MKTIVKGVVTGSNKGGRYWFAKNRAKTLQS